MSRRRKPAVEKSQPASSKNFTYACAVLAALFVLCAAWALTREWDKPLLDLHSFRQTQTAISTYYMVGNPGVFLDYTTPVLGKPWRIPLEVPFYQWVVARWHDSTGMGLDQSGKLVSIAFLLACIWPLWKLLGVIRIQYPPPALSDAGHFPFDAAAPVLGAVVPHRNDGIVPVAFDGRLHLRRIPE